MKPIVAVRLCGCVWLFAGIMLLRKGIYFACELAESHEPVISSSFFSSLCSFFDSSHGAVMALVLFAVCVGMIKSRTVLAKSAERNIARLKMMKNVPFYAVFDKKMTVLIVLMMGLGFAIGRSPLAFEWRMVIDMAIGSALVMGSRSYLLHSS